MVLLGSATLPGTRYGKLNQDYSLHAALHSAETLHRLGIPQAYIAIVLDGHGMLGEVAAQEAGAAIMQHLETSILRTTALGSLPTSEIRSLLTEAFHVAHDAVLRCYHDAPLHYRYPVGAPEERRYTLGKAGGDVVFLHPLSGPRLLEFGTTATVCIVQGRTIAVAHVGDSLVVLGSEDGDPSEGAYAAEVLTECHSGHSATERDRVEKECNENDVIPGRRARFRGTDGYLHVDCPTGAFSLAMTRALGHRLMSRVGVSPTPEVIVRRLAPQDVCVIAASDGVWETLSAAASVREVCDALADGQDTNGAAAALCRAAVSTATGKMRTRADNTTAVLIVFDEILVDDDVATSSNDGGTGSGGGGDGNDSGGAGSGSRGGESSCEDTVMTSQGGI